MWQRILKAVKEDDLKAIISKKYGALKQIDVFEGPAHYYQVENLSIKNRIYFCIIT